MKITKLLAAVLSLIAMGLASQAQNLAEFGSSASNLFTIDPNSTVGWSPSQTSTGISLGVGSTDSNGNQFGGAWGSTWSLASNTGLQINITGTIPSPGSLFTVTLFNASFDQTKEFQGNFADTAVANNYLLSFQTETSSFTSIGGMTLTAGGTGNSMNVSVNNLSVVPEPSTYALMALGGLALFFIARRRKAQV